MSLNLKLVVKSFYLLICIGNACWEESVCYALDMDELSRLDLLSPKFPLILCAFALQAYGVKN